MLLSDQLIKTSKQNHFIHARVTHTHTLTEGGAAADLGQRSSLGLFAYLWLRWVTIELCKYLEPNIYYISRYILYKAYLLYIYYILYIYLLLYFIFIILYIFIFLRSNRNICNFSLRSIKYF